MEFMRAGAVTLLCVLLAACKGEENKDQAAHTLPPPLVGVVELRPMDIPLVATFMGQTEGSRSAAVQPQVSGVLRARLFEEGAWVSQGDTLFEIDDAPFRAALKEAQGRLDDAESSLEEARREYVRVRNLYAGNAVSQQQRDQALYAFLGAQGRVAAAQAAVDSARIQLGYCHVTAPFDGWTSHEVTTVGNIVGPGTTLTYIHQGNPMDVDFSVPSAELFSMRDMEARGRARSYGQGSSASLLLLDGKTYALQGRVIFLDTQVDDQTSSVRAKARFPNPGGTLMPGQFAAVEVSGASLIQAIMIPQEAVRKTEGGNAVYVVEDGGVVRLTPVTLGPAFGSYFFLEDGLKGGEKIIVQGVNKAAPGAVVTPELIRQDMGTATPTPDSQSPVTGQGVEDAPAPVQAGEAGHE